MLLCNGLLKKDYPTTQWLRPKDYPTIQRVEKGLFEWKPATLDASHRGGRILDS